MPSVFVGPRLSIKNGLQCGSKADSVQMRAIIAVYSMWDDKGLYLGFSCAEYK